MNFISDTASSPSSSQQVSIDTLRHVIFHCRITEAVYAGERDISNIPVASSVGCALGSRLVQRWLTTPPANRYLSSSTPRSATLPGSACETVTSFHNSRPSICASCRLCPPRVLLRLCELRQAAICSSALRLGSTNKQCLLPTNGGDGKIMKPSAVISHRFASLSGIAMGFGTSN